MRTEYLNGGNIDAAIESLLANIRMIDVVLQELHDGSIVHPRDYIDGSAGAEYAADVAEWRAQQASLLAFQNYCQRRAMELADLRDKRKLGGGAQARTVS